VGGELQMGFEGFIAEARRLLGDRVYVEGDIIDRYSRDWWPLAILLEKMGLWSSRAKAVLFPESVEEVSRLVRLAGEQGVCIIPYGGGSSVTGATSPREGCVILSLSRLNRILEFSEEDLIVTVEAGALLREVELWLNERGYTLRYTPQSFDIASVGGSIAAGGVGQYTTGYGGIEDVVVNLEVVLPTGEVVWTRSVTTPRSAMGPDIKSMFIASEGSLGIITKAVLRVIPKPEYVLKGAFEVPSFQLGLKVVRELLLRGFKPAIARVSDDREALLRFDRSRPILLLSYEGWDSDLVTLLWSKTARHVESMGGVYVGEELFNKWLDQRFKYLDEMKLLDSLNLWFETIDIATTWSKAYKAYTSVREGLERLGNIAVMCHASHFYLTGVALYFTIVYEKNPELYWRIVDTALEQAMRAGATLSHHHGIGLLRARWVEIDPGQSRVVLERVKKALDPRGVLKPIW
jgi:alkyldihydroxyacetonephosphate synthase